MYKRFFGLRANPFNMNPDPRYLFLTRHTEEALACLTYGIQSRKGFVLLTGEVGTGKTTLVNKLLEWLRLQHIATAFVFNPRMDVPEFLEYMLSDFGIQSPPTGKSQTLRRLYNWLLDRHRAGETSVLIVDEAQNLTDELLEEIRLLTNLETFTEKLLQVVLVGQPELEQKMKQPNLRQLRQRLVLQAKTHALSLEEARSYIAERLRIAGGNGNPIFSPEAVNAIHRYSNGIPRVVNLICEHCLVSAFVDEQKTVSATVVEAIARDFELREDDLTPGSGLPGEDRPDGCLEDSLEPGGPATRGRGGANRQSGETQLGGEAEEIAAAPASSLVHRLPGSRPDRGHPPAEQRLQRVAQGPSAGDQAGEQWGSAVALERLLVQGTHETTSAFDQCGAGGDIPFVFGSQGEGGIGQSGGYQGQLVGHRADGADLEGSRGELLPLTALGFAAAGQDDGLAEIGPQTGASRLAVVGQSAIE